MRKILIFTASLFFTLIFVAIPAVNGVTLPNNTVTPLPNNTVTPSEVKLTNPLSVGDSICDVLSAILDLVVKIGSLVAVLLIIWSGFLFIKAQGNPAEISNAKRTFYYTVIGTAVLLGSSVIANIVVNTVFSVTNEFDGSRICNI